MNRPRNIKHAWARFCRAEEGATIVEFALVAVPFFLLMIGLAEISLIGFAQTSLDYAVSDTSRVIRTGQAQTNGIDYDEIKEDMCDELNGLMIMDCNELYLDVAEFDSFVDADAGDLSPMDEDGEFQSDNFDFDPGEPSSIVVVRAFYRWRVITPFFQHVFANATSGDRILASTMMFRNEPFPDPGS